MATSVEVDGAREDLRGLLDECGLTVAFGLSAAIVAGRINGELYGVTPSQDKCVLGTAAYLLDESLGCPARWTGRYRRLEAFALPIQPGDSPATKGPLGTSGRYRAAMLMLWIDEWIAGQGER